MSAIISREDAKAAGLARFCTGRACRRGHLTERYVCNGDCVQCALDKDRKWRKDNPERTAELKALDFEKHREKRLETVRRRQRLMQPHHNITKRAWRKANPGLASAITQRRRARKANAGGHITYPEIVALTKTQGGRCGYCKRKVPLTLDHIIPLSKGGEHTIRNAQMLCVSCNSSKGARDPIQFAQTRGLLL